MLQNPLTGTLSKLAKFIKSIEDGIAINDKRRAEKEARVEEIVLEINDIDTETAQGKRLLEKLKA